MQMQLKFIQMLNWLTILITKMYFNDVKITFKNFLLACYIDAIEEPFDPDKQYSQWSDLPDLLLEEVFSYLTVQQRYYASLVS